MTYLCNDVNILDGKGLTFLKAFLKDFKTINVLAIVKSFYSKSCSSPTFYPPISCIFIPYIKSLSFCYKISFKSLLSPRSLLRTLQIRVMYSSYVLPFCPCTSCCQALVSPHWIAFSFACTIYQSIRSVKWGTIR